MVRFCFPPRGVAILLILAIAIAVGAAPAASQEEGFQSINCGGEEYTDNKSNITWEEDPFQNRSDADLYGSVGKVNSSFSNVTNEMSTLRYFPNHAKNKKFCYSLAISSGNTYFVRASFLYGNYDGLNEPPTFALIFNYDVWKNVSTSSSATPTVSELTFVSKWEDLYICLAPQAGSNQTPFISTLEVRLLVNGMYNESTEPNVPTALALGYGLELWKRINYGAKTDEIIRYGDDDYDRIWEANTTGPTLSTNESNVGTYDGDDPENPPRKVMATAITSGEAGGNLSLTFEGFGGGAGGYRVEMHFEEVARQLPIRSFEVAFPNADGKLTNFTINQQPVLPAVNGASAFVMDQIMQLPNPFQITFFRVDNSERPPLVNAAELFVWTPGVLSTTGTSTDDLIAIQQIQKDFKIKGNGQGDPCIPKGFEWTWLTCNNATPPRITQINLASQNLIGDISPFFNNLTKLNSLNLSHNMLTGQIPNLDKLQELQYLDVSYNNLCGSSPKFQQSVQQTVNYKHDGNYRLCDGPKCQCNPNTSTPTKSTKKYIVAIYLLAALYVVSIIILFILLKAQRMRKLAVQARKKGIEDLKILAYVTKMFTYSEISSATQNFTTILGQGGFGKVYHGLLPTGEAIAVKLLEDVSKQGLKEFYNEVAILSRVRHKNLVCLLGYCVENTYMLIYEYVAKGNLRDLLYGEVQSTDKPLPWKIRLNIALDAAQGLEYLHNGCDLVVIHRDVKSSNILLSDKMQAKVADFGLSRLKEGDLTKSHVSTMNVVGTPGYLDPAYNATNQLTDKSDVYSFGIVLLELICGRAPINMFTSPPHIVDWASSSVMQGKLGDVVDPTINNGYKMESMWKVVDVAFGCVEDDRARRPKMSQVLQVLQNALDIEMDEGLIPSSQDVSIGSSTSDEKMPDLQYIKKLQMIIKPR